MTIKDFSPESAIHILEPDHQSVPVIFACPHSGREYPADFLIQSQLDPITLRSSEDAFVDELFQGVVTLGAPLLVAQFPRVYVDANREALELDPAMFEDTLPERANTSSARVTAGIGTIPKTVGDNKNIYRQRLKYEDARKRLESCYFPYHQALQGLIDNTLSQFGSALVVDCHSMPTGRQQKAEFILGNRWGSSCSPMITNLAERTILGLGYSVRCNVPYAGGYTTEHYGQPDTGVQAIQIEIDRSLYMDERSISRLPVFDNIAEHINRLAEALCNVGVESIAAQ